MKRAGIWVVTCLMLLPLFALAQGADKEEAPSSPSARMERLFDFWNRQDQPGFALVVVKDGRVVYQQVMGLACQEHAVAITPGTLFNVGEGAEPFTGMALSLLEKQGRLSLDDDIRKYIPELPDLGTPVKLRNLLYQTSGLRDWSAVVALTGRETQELTIEGVIKIVQAQKKLAFTPGERFQDSNTNYDLLAEVVKRVTGKPFSDWAWENIFKPLKMTTTLFRDNYRSILDNQAFSYNYTRKEYLHGIDTLSLTGSHSLYSSLADLSKWLIALENGTLGDAGTVAKTLTTGALNNGRSLGFAYGWNVEAGPGPRRVIRMGTWAGSQSALVYYPDQKLGFALLANWDYTSVEGFLPEIADAYLPAPAPAAAPAKPAPPQAPPKPKAVKVSPEKLEALVGDYRIAPGRIFSISRTGGQLFVGLPGAKFPLTAVSETEFRLDIASARIVFHKDKMGKVTEFVWDQGGEQVAPRVVLVKPTAQELQEFAGEYFNDELNLRFGVAVQGGALFLSSPVLAETRLTPDEKDHFGSGLPGTPMVIFERDAQGRLSGFVIDSDLVRDLVFKKN